MQLHYKELKDKYIYSDNVDELLKDCNMYKQLKEDKIRFPMMVTNDLMEYEIDKIKLKIKNDLILVKMFLRKKKIEKLIEKSCP